MDFWKIMNVVAWGLCGLIAYQLISDVIRIERARLKDMNTKEDR